MESKSQSLLVMTRDELVKTLKDLQDQLRDQLIHVRWTRSDIKRVHRILVERFPEGK